MKDMLKTWDKQFPGRLETIFTSLQNVAPSQLADRNLFDFVNLLREPMAIADKDLDLLAL
jgi:tRNA 2-thiocytidine biosynthesis protein TtcA